MVNAGVLENRLKCCDFCPNCCGCNRLQGETGICGNNANPAIYQHFVHYGEEITLVPAFIINMAGCSLDCPTCPEKCRFHQAGIPVGTPENYAGMMAAYFKKKQMPKSIEWIGGEPSTQLHFVLETSQKLKEILPDCPPIYLNTNAYFDPNLLEYMHGIIDAFVFDFKCMESCDSIVGHFPEYVKTVKEVILRGVHEFEGEHILRHLVMPGHLECCTKKIIDWCSLNIPDVTFNLMTTFHDFRAEAPCFELPQPEAQAAIELAKAAGFSRLLIDGNH